MAGQRILIVEDDFDTRYMLSLILKGEGYEVSTAADGEGALAIVFDQPPDLIITDISMPCLNGIELTRSIRLKKETAWLPILAMTAFGGTTLKAAIDAGASACTRKPVKMSEFLPLIKTLISERHKEIGPDSPLLIIAGLKEDKTNSRARISQTSHEQYEVICATVAHDIQGEFSHIGSSVSAIRESTTSVQEIQEECEVIERSVINSERLLKKLRGSQDTCESICLDIKREFSQIGSSVSAIRESTTSIQEIQEECEVIERSVLYGVISLQGLLNFIDKGEYQIESVNILELLQNFEILMRPRLPLRVRLCVTVDKGTKIPFVRSDRRQLMGAIMQLVTNASTALPRAGGDIEVRVKQQGKNIFFLVKDNGLGIPKNIRGKLLKEPVPSRTGSGQGLFLLNKVIAKMGGKLELQKTSSKGTVFAISMQSAVPE